MANSIWVESSLQINANYERGLKNYCQASVHPPTAIDIVSQWCRSATHGKIKEILNSFPDTTAVILINAVYFKFRGIGFVRKTRSGLCFTLL